MFFSTFPKLYQNCAIFPIARDSVPFPMNWKTRGPKVHISCTWVQCATLLKDKPRQSFLYIHQHEKHKLGRGHWDLAFQCTWAEGSSALLWSRVVRRPSVCLSLRKKFFRSQAQRAGNRQILEARKKITQARTFFAKAWAVWKFWYD